MPDLIAKTVSLHDFNKIIDFVSTLFSEYEPMCKACNSSSLDIRNTFQFIIRECCKQRLSSFIEDSNRNVISVCLTLPYVLYNSLNLTFISSSLIPLIKVLKQLDTEPEDQSLLRNSVYIFMLGTDPLHSNQGYTNKTLDHSCKLAQRYLYDSVVSDLTNIISQHILINKKNFKIITKVHYDEYSEFKTIRDTTYAARVIKYL